jgi:hypothetical protein
MPELKPIREILRRTDMMLEIHGKQTGYSYAYERMAGVSGNAHVTRARALGWEFVKGDDPENSGQRDETGRCVVGDVILMRIKTETLTEIETEVQNIVTEKRGTDITNSTIAQQLSEELSRKLGRQTNVSFSYTDPKELANRR